VIPVSSPEPLPPFPLFLDLAGACVLVVGGGDAAVAKLRLLLASGAVPRVVDPAPSEALVALAEDGGFVVHRRAFEQGDLDGARLCYVALDEGAKTVVAAARQRGVLVNAVDQPALCDFTTPAMVQRGRIAIAISTAGVAPALARAMRARIEAAIPQGYGALAAFCAKWRARAAEAFGREERQRFWDSVLGGPEAEAVLRGGEAKADALMRERLAARRTTPAGRASLVGAGPGDPELLTLKALRALQEADVILYDKLIGPAVLDLARRDARRVDVGKRCGRHAMSQAAINRLMLRFAQDGLHVVRLKGGDPFVFGRGGEELDALRAADVPVEVIPGVTAACAAAAGLQAPLTHRGLARSLHLVTAHGKDEGLPPHDWRALAAMGGTLAVYMGVRTLPALARALLDAGRDPGTPAVAVENASLPHERRVAGTLASIAEAVRAAGLDGPTLVLIGEVLDLARSAPAEVGVAA
jgi:uroporphyrin-III C-methyltransferase / precorrin-2 dehydrogenase / sirohydrochlorin ferrochelatase